MWVFGRGRGPALRARNDVSCVVWEAIDHLVLGLSFADRILVLVGWTRWVLAVEWRLLVAVGEGVLVLIHLGFLGGEVVEEEWQLVPPLCPRLAAAVVVVVVLLAYLEIDKYILLRKGVFGKFFFCERGSL